MLRVNGSASIERNDSGEGKKQQLAHSSLDDVVTLSALFWPDLGKKTNEQSNKQTKTSSLPSEKSLWPLSNCPEHRPEEELASLEISTTPPQGQPTKAVFLF